MRDSLAEVVINNELWVYILNMPKEYRKRHLQRLERKIRNQREQILLLEQEWSKAIHAQTIMQIMIKDLKHKGEQP